MGKQIDLSDLSRLTENDILYCLQRNMLSPAQLRELELSENDVRTLLAGEAPPVIHVDEQGERLVLTEEERDHILERRRLAEDPTIDPEGLTRVLVPSEDDKDKSSDDRPEDYDEWTNDDLRTELFNRELSLDGKKRDLVARLREYDEALEEQAKQQAKIDAGGN